jgi:hypothetical protein
MRLTNRETYYRRYVSILATEVAVRHNLKLSRRLELSTEIAEKMIDGYAAGDISVVGPAARDAALSLGIRATAASIRRYLSGD